MLAAHEDGAIVGGAGSLPFELTLDDVHARDEPIAYLWASDDRIYGRFGYGIGVVQGRDRSCP